MTSHVVSLELAKQLKEAGYPKVSAFYYSGDNILIYGEQEPVKSLKLPYVAAPLATELLEQLPEEVNYYSNRDKKDIKIYLRIRKFDDGFGVDYSTRIQGYNLEQLLKKEVRKNFGSLSEVAILKTGSTLPDALASMWLYLKKEELL